MDVIEITDDLTTMSRNAIVKTMKREGNDLGEDFVNHLPDELREIHRAWRKAQGIDSGVIDEKVEGNDVQPWKLVIPVVAIHSLGRDAFVGAIKYRDLDKIDVDAEVQRPEAKRRIPEIARYVANDDGYFGAAVVTIRGANEGKAMFDENTLIIEGGAKIVVNDGQHRLAGIKAAIAKGDVTGERLDDALPLVIYTDLSTTEEKQLFTDINANAKKPPRAIMDAYDERDLLRRFAHDLVKSSKVFEGKTNFVKTKIGVKDPQLFTFSAVVDACGELFDDLSPETYDEHLEDARDFWRKVDDAMGRHFEEKNVSTTKNGLVSLARLYGYNVDFTKLSSLDWSKDGELARVAGDAGGSNAAIKALSDELKREVVGEGE